MYQKQSENLQIPTYKDKPIGWGRKWKPKKYILINSNYGDAKQYCFVITDGDVIRILLTKN